MVVYLSLSMITYAAVWTFISLGSNLSTEVAGYKYNVTFWLLVGNCIKLVVKFFTMGCFVFISCEGFCIHYNNM